MFFYYHVFAPFVAGQYIIIILWSTQSKVFFKSRNTMTVWIYAFKFDLIKWVSSEVAAKVFD